MFEQKRIDMKKKLLIENDLEKALNKKKNMSNSKSVANKFKDNLKNPGSPRSIKSQSFKSSEDSGLKNSDSSSVATVESLLNDLNKIEKESTELLNVESKPKYSASSTVSSVSGEKVNSILNYLNDATANDPANNFVPKQFKDYKLDISEYAFMQEKLEMPPSTPKKLIFSGRKPTKESEAVDTEPQRTNSIKKTSNKPTSVPNKSVKFIG